MYDIRKRCLEAPRPRALTQALGCYRLRLVANSALSAPTSTTESPSKLTNPGGQNAVNLRLRHSSVCFIAAVLCGLLVPVFAGTAELFRYRLQTKDGRQFNYVFESSAEPSPSSITREEATKIAADWMATFYHSQLGNIEYAEFYECCRKGVCQQILTDFTGCGSLGRIGSGKSGWSRIVD